MKTSAAAGLILAALAAGAICFGCDAYRPYEYRDEREVTAGPGLFSGEDGVFTIRSKEKPRQPQKGAEAPAGGDDADKEAEPPR